ncbi:MAG: DUF4198 domain-containing protein [Pseudomonas sp.]|uniref:DUF4198 domain-containing protein n=1 Tax=Pseudomonas sp. TaxID=306 RepID=UPI003396DF0E
MSRFHLLPLCALGAALLSPGLQAHGLWTEQRRGSVEVIYGHGAADDAFKGEKVSGSWAFDRAGRMIPITVQRLADQARLQPLKPPAVLAVALDNGAWSQTPDKKWVNQGRLQVPDSVHSLHTYKYSLAVYEEGAKLPPLEALKLVILPEVDPLLVGVGKPLPVRVLVDGKPAAGVKLIGDFRGAPHVISAETDAQGRAQVLVRNEGLNIIGAELYVPVANDANISERGLFASLTFLGQAHHE